MPNPQGGYYASGVGNSGDGYAKITYLGIEMWDYPYNGTNGSDGYIEEFTAPHNGNYKLEVWGAQGGTANGNRGGYGGYSVGTINLSKNDKLYIVTGGKGGNNTSTTAGLGGYNGGGNGDFYSTTYPYSCGGGGATHIATVSGLLKDLLPYKDTGGTNISNEILIVAGGGGTGAYNSSNNGSGLGCQSDFNSLIKCGSSFASRLTVGGTQTSGGNNSVYPGPGSFGQGGTSPDHGMCGSNGGGGAGWYGGSRGCDVVQLVVQDILLVQI